MNLQQTLTQWSRNHWSVNPPSSYRLVQAGISKPVGLEFAKSVAEFNMAWAQARGVIETPRDVSYIRYTMTAWQPVLDELVDGYPLREWVCMMQPAKLDRWLARESVDRSVRKIMRPTVRLAMQIQSKAVA